MLEAKDFSWSISNTEVGLKFWVKFITSIWVRAMYHPEGNPQIKVKILEIEKTLESVSFTYVNRESQNTLHKIYNLAKELTYEIRKQDKQMQIKAYIEDVSKKLILEWWGQWTEDRYLRVSIDQRNYPIVFVEWDTGTNKESSFMALPSSAIEFSNADGGRCYSRFADEEYGYIDTDDKISDQYIHLVQKFDLNYRAVCR